MFSRKIFGIMIILLLAAGIAITTTRCYDDKNEARVTIHLERNDLAAMGIQTKKHFIDKVLQFFSTPACAWSGWYYGIGELTLKITSTSFEEKTFLIPQSATTYTVTVPSAENVRFEVTSYITEGETGSIPKNWGGHSTLSLGPGDQDITINMIPMTLITGVDGTSPIEVTWITENIPSYVTAYKVYRSINVNGPYTYINSVTIIGALTTSYSDSSISLGQTYYYRISPVSTYGEGVMCDPVSN